MKKLFVLIIISILCIHSLLFSKPKTEKGFRAGIAFANVFRDLDNPRFVSGASFGIFYRTYYRDDRAVQYEINYTQKGYSIDIDDDWKDTTTND